MKTGFGFAKLAGFTGFPVLAKTGFHSLVLTVSDVGSTSHGESAGWPGSSGSVPSMAGGLS